MPNNRIIFQRALLIVRPLAHICQSLQLVLRQYSKIALFVIIICLAKQLQIFLLLAVGVDAVFLLQRVPLFHISFFLFGQIGQFLHDLPVPSTQPIHVFCNFIINGKLVAQHLRRLFSRLCTLLFHQVRETALLISYKNRSVFYLPAFSFFCIGAIDMNAIARISIDSRQINRYCRHPISSLMLPCSEQIRLFQFVFLFYASYIGFFFHFINTAPLIF